MARILVVGADDRIRRLAARTLRCSGHEVDEVGTGDQARDRLEESAYDVVVTDFALPDADGLEVTRLARAVQPDAEVVVLAAPRDMPFASEAIRQGAYDLLPAPVGESAFAHAVARALEKRALAAEIQRLRAELAGRGPAPEDGGPPVIAVPVGTPLEEVERLLIRETLRTTGGNKQRAASLLGIAARTIYRKLEDPSSA